MAAIPVKSLKKALDLLDLLLAEEPDGGRPLSELARQMGMPANSTHNLLKTMVACGYVEQMPDGRYRPGAKLRQIGRLNRFADEAVRARIGHVLRELGERLGEACVLATLRGGQRVVIARVDCRQAIRVDAAMAEEGRIYDSPTGRVLAANAAPEELEAILARNGLPGALWDGISAREGLETALAALRSEGFSFVGPDAGGVIAVACPVLGGDGRLFGALGCHAPEFRCPAEKQAQIRRELCQAAERLGEILSSV
ncbi:MAG: IclR family transcriptional regulator [Lentisphaeria bacterium]|jgi:IclR family acetate operon transcriptional repressor